MDPEDLVASAALSFDPEGLLAGPALARLQWRKARARRRCGRCQVEKPLAEFSLDSRNPDGLRRYCRSCAAGDYKARKRAHSA